MWVLSSSGSSPLVLGGFGVLLLVGLGRLSLLAVVFIIFGNECVLESVAVDISLVKNEGWRV